MHSTRFLARVDADDARVHADARGRPAAVARPPGPDPRLRYVVIIRMRSTTHLHTLATLEAHMPHRQAQTAQ